MSPTTLSDFYANLGALVVDGVSRRLDFPPTSLTSADLPTQWVQAPAVDEGPMTYGTHGGWPTLRAQLVIATASFLEGIQSDNYIAALAMADSVLNALRAVNVSSLNLGKSKLSWTVSVGKVTVNETDYWAVIADIQGAG